MSSREQILSAITANKPALVPLPEIDISAVIQYDDVVEKFKTTLEAIGGMVMKADGWEQLRVQLQEEKAAGSFVVNTIDALGAVDANLAVLTDTDLEPVDKAYIKATLGVAENGSVWVYEHQMHNRLLPFICQHLAIVLEKKDIVPTMHHAYKTIDVAKEGFGAFIAGPSKTADIEQSLVIGAHGARSMELYLI